MILHVFSHFNSKICFQTFRHANIYFNTLKLPCPAGTIIVVDTNKPAFCISENKGADQLQTATAQLISALLRYIDRTIPLQPKSEFQASNHLLWLCNLKTGAAYIMSCLNKHWSLFTGDTRRLTMFSIIPPI